MRTDCTGLKTLQNIFLVMKKVFKNAANSSMSILPAKEMKARKLKKLWGIRSVSILIHVALKQRKHDSPRPSFNSSGSE